MLFAITPGEEADADNHKGLIVLLSERLAECPPEVLVNLQQGISKLPDHLLSQELFEAQDIRSQGFGICWEQLPGAPALRTSKMRGVVSRKTFLPTVQYLVS